MDTKPVNTLVYKISIGVLLAIIAVMAWMLVSQKNEIITQVKDSGNMQMELQGQLDSLLAEHERVKVSYGELSNSLSERDSIINVKALEIKKLLGSKSELAVVKRKLAQLQQITQVYEQQIDSLFTVNRKLKAENDKPDFISFQSGTNSPVIQAPSGIGSIESPLIWKVRYFRSGDKNGS